MTQKIDADAIKQLANILKETGLSEIEYECDGARIYISKNSQAHHNAVHYKSNNNEEFFNNQTSTSLNNQFNNTSNKHDVVQDLKTKDSIRSPMVGTVYLSSSPGSEAFVKVGSNVKIGDTLLIIEAMKIMNPIKALKNGIVSKILVQDGKPVEYDEILILIDEIL